MLSRQRHEIAARLRGLIAGQEGGNLAAVADRLGVEEVSLRMSVDEASPYPTIDVIAAVVAYYGVDPTYLLTGQYDAGTHRQVLIDPGVASEAIRRVATNETLRPISVPPHEPPRLHIV